MISFIGKIGYISCSSAFLAAKLHPLRGPLPRMHRLREKALGTAFSLSMLTWTMSFLLENHSVFRIENVLLDAVSIIATVSSSLYLTRRWQAP